MRASHEARNLNICIYCVVDFSFLSWNIQGKRHFTKTRFSKIEPFLRNARADILCLQEAHELGAQLPRFESFKGFNTVLPENERNQNVIISRFPIRTHGELEFPRFANRSLEKALWADIACDGTLMRVYNCHFAIVGVGPSCREQQLQFLLNHAEEHQGPAIICGDFNTTIPAAGIKRILTQIFHLEPNHSMRIGNQYFSEDERYPFARAAEKHGFREATDITKATWRIAPLRWELFKVKLDWMFVRNVETRHVALSPYISDHRAIYAECSVA